MSDKENDNAAAKLVSNVLLTALARVVSVFGVPIALAFFYWSAHTLAELDKAVERSIGVFEQVLRDHERRIARVEDDVRTLRNVR